MAERYKALGFVGELSADVSRNSIAIGPDSHSKDTFRLSEYVLCMV